jgi:hypothetical protein
VKVCALEPGGMRTNWGARANQDTPELLPDYEPSVGAVAKALKSYWGKEVSDPVKVAQVVLRLAASDRLPAHLLIGSDAVRFAGEAEKTREAEAAQWRSPCRRPHAKQDRTERRRVQHSAFARRYAVSLAGRFGPVFVCCFYWRSAPTHRRLVAVSTMVSVVKIVQFSAGRLIELPCSLDPIWTLRPRPLRAARERSSATDQ